MDQNKGYLVYNFKEHTGGLDDHLLLLQRFLSISLLLNRVPVITGFHSDIDHNFALPKKVMQFRNYVDLSKTQIFKMKADKTIEQIVSPLQWVSDQDFDSQSFPEKQICYVNIYEGVETEVLEQNVQNIFGKNLESYRVLCIKPVHTADSMSTDLGYASHKMLRLPLRLCPYTVMLQPSQRVEDLTEVVLNHFGTSRGDITNFKNMLNKQYRFGQRIVETARSINCFYACLHVRTTDSPILYDRFYFASLRTQIKRTIKVANLERKSKLYIMSDILKSGYFDFLKLDYQVYRYYDFPELEQLVSGENSSADNYMLYSVEKNIMAYALIQIMPPRNNRQIFPLDASYRIPFFVKGWHKIYSAYMKLTSPKFNLKRSFYLRINLVLKKLGF